MEIGPDEEHERDDAQALRDEQRADDHERGHGEDLRPKRPGDGRREDAGEQRDEADFKRPMRQAPGESPGDKNRRRTRGLDRGHAADPVERREHRVRQPAVIGERRAGCGVRVRVDQRHGVRVPEVESQPKVPPGVALRGRKTRDDTRGDEHQPDRQPIERDVESSGSSRRDGIWHTLRHGLI